MILIVGGTGLVGGHLLQRLINRSERVRCTVRTAHMFQRLRDLGLEPVYADVRDYDSLVPAMRDVRTVINLATAIHERQFGDFSSVVYVGVKNLVRAAQEVGLSRIIHVGALGRIDSAYNPRWSYLYWKSKGTDFLEASKLDFTILETSLLFGPGDQHLSAIALTLKYLPFVPIPGTDASKTLFQPLWVGDLVTCLLGALDDPRTVRRRFALGGPDVLDYVGLVKLVGEILNKKPKIVFVPRYSARIVLETLRLVMAYPPVTTALLNLAGINSTADSIKTHQLFGINPLRIVHGAGYLEQVGFAELRAWVLGLPSHGIYARRPPTASAFSEQTEPARFNSSTKDLPQAE